MKNEPLFEEHDICLSSVWDYELARGFNLTKEGVQRLVDSSQTIIISSKENLIPFTDIVRYRSGEHKDMYPRYVKELLQINGKSIIERAKLGFFDHKDGFYEYAQNLIVEIDNREFDYWFCMKLRQYSEGVKFTPSFLEYHYLNSFSSNKQDYIDFLEDVILQYSDELLDDKVVVKVEGYIFALNHPIEINAAKKIPELKGEYTTFFLTMQLKNRTLFDTESLYFNRLFSLFSDIRKNFFDESTTYKQFISIFKKADISKSDKIIWCGTLNELHWFIKSIEESSLCDHISLKNNDKWIIGTLCFKYKRGRNPFKGRIDELTEPSKLADASTGKNTKTDLLNKYIEELKSICESSPNG